MQLLLMKDLHEACGQHMLEKAPDELDDIEGNLADAMTAFLSIGEGNRLIFDSHDSGIGDSHPEDVRCEVLQSFHAIPDGLTVDIPGNLPA